MRLVWRASALEDLETIIAYIAERDAPAAERLQSAIAKCAARLRERPLMYRPGRVEGTREAVVHPNYILVYEIGADTVEITAVVHARRQYP
ncbi:MAG TPA: type II toxin-antitoxin system RelE/ParE family toxin [Allosphingosinicella sp.]|nr:type II toxin-antitoxin system RelE/ParE family toxin [Allosphingosinicella sp.]